MLVALNEKAELVIANTELSKTNIYLCPACKKRVSLKIGEIIRPYFAHYQSEACHLFSEGETEEHVEGKIQLANYLKSKMCNVQLEAYLPHLQQRPDILFEKDEQKFAIEFQCSPLPIEKIVSRTQGYLNAGYKVIWILGSHFTYKNKLTAFHKACLYTSREHKEPLLVHYDVKNHRLEIRCDFKLNHRGEIYEQLYRGKLSIENKINWIHKPKKIRNSKDIFYKEQDQFMKTIRYPSPKLQSFLQLLYQNHENVISMPKELYIKMPNEWVFQTHPMSWKYLFILWLESFPKKKILTRKMLCSWLYQKIEMEEIIFYKSPQLTIEYQLQPFIEFIQELKNNNILKEVGHFKWSYQQPLTRYKNLEEKING